jgi:putative endonuclease
VPEDGVGADLRIALGLLGESLACEALTGAGYAILARRFRTRIGEIDIVCRDGPALVFVEVKARRSTRFGTPAEAVTPRKQRRILTMAQIFLGRHRLEGTRCRFDVVSILMPAGQPPTVQIIRDAFGD